MLLPVINNLVASLLLGAATFTNPTTPKALSFDASAFVTNSNKIRLSVTKLADKPVEIVLRSQQQDILYRHTLGKKETSYAFLFTMSNLSDGQYELEIKSSEGSIRKQVTLLSTVKEPVRTIALQ